MTHTTELDLGPLTWVKSEIDQALSKAEEALGLAASSSGERTTHIQFAQTHLHQACGALSIVGLDGLTQFAIALERLLGSLAREEQVGGADEAISVCQRGLASIGNYLEDIVRGAPDQALRLAELYGVIEGARGNKVPNPADLFYPDLAVRAPVRQKGPELKGQAWDAGLRRARADFQRGLLSWLKAPGKPEGAILMRNAASQAQALQASHTSTALWWAAQGFFDALAQGALPTNTLIRNLCTRYDKELRQQQRGLRTPPEGLLRETLYWLAQSGLEGTLQQGIRNAWQLDKLIPAAGSTVTEVPLAPLLKSLHQEVLAAKRAWDEFSDGQAAALPRFESHVGKLGELGRQLGRPAFEQLTEGLSQFVAWLRKDPLRFGDAAGLEAASALLLVEIALDRGVSESDFENQVADTVARLEALSRGEQLAAADDSATIDAARKLNERQARAQVAREIISSLAQVEQALDDYFRNPNKRAPLATLANPLHQIQGALTLVGDDLAVALIERSADTVARLAEGQELEPSAHETLAHELSALGFYVQALKHGPADLRSFLEPEAGEEAGPEPEPTALAEELESEAVFEFEAPLESEAASDTAPVLEAAQRVEEAGPTHAPFEAPPLPPALPAPSAATPEEADEIDEELLEIFLEEAREVLDTITSHIDAIRPSVADPEALTVVRRGFHTLKGSGRMVGLTELGDAAWAIEQTLNRWLQLEWPPNDTLVELIEEAHRRFSVWVEQIAAKGGLSLDVQPLMADAERLRLMEAPETATAAASAELISEPTLAEATESRQPPEEALTAEESQPGADFGASDESLPSFEQAAAVEQAGPGTEDMPLPTLDSEASAEEEPEPETADGLLLLDESELGAEILLEDGIWATGEDPTLKITSLEGVPTDALEEFQPEPDAGAVSAAPSAEAGAPETAQPATEASALEAESAPPAFLPEAEPFDFGDLDLELESEPASSDTSTEEEVEPARDDSFATFADDLSDQAIPDVEAEPVVEPPLSETAQVTAEPTALDGLREDNVPTPAPTSEEGLAAEAVAPEEPSPAPGSAAPLPATTTQSLRIGDIELSSGLYDLFRSEAKVHLASLAEECDILLRNPSHLPGEHAQRSAHTLAGISGTARIGAMHTLARALEHALERLIERQTVPTIPEAHLLEQSVVTLDTMLGEAERLSMPLRVTELEEQLDSVGRDVAPEELEPVAEEEAAYEIDAEPAADAIGATTAAAAQELAKPEPPAVIEAAPAPEAALEPAAPVHDDLDAQLLPIFIEEGNDLLAQLNTTLREWRSDPARPEPATATARLLHTLKGSARMAGAMRLGEHVHQLESRLESALNAGRDTESLLEELESGLDLATQSIERLGRPEPEEQKPETAQPATAAIAAEMEGAEPGGALSSTLRVRADTIDNFVNQAGEIGIARTRIDGELRTLRMSLLDLTENVIRLRNQLREVEIQAEMQMQTRIAQAESTHAEFDPLEMDRYTRLQELTRMMAESVGDVTTVQQNLLRNLDGAELALNGQARMSRELQQALMQVRMVPFDSLADRLYRIVRQSAKELGKRVNLDLRGGRIELDRGVLETITAPLEHLLRNAVAHGIELPEQRVAAGKAPIGQITLTVRQEGNEIAISLSDDGAGLDLQRIAERGRAQGLLGDDEEADVRRLTNLIFMPGFTTSASVSTVAGRGVGMDVVKAETASVGGRIDVSSTAGEGTEFRIFLPLTLAATQALLVRVGTATYAIPSGMIAQVMELKPDPLDQVISDGGVHWQDAFYPHTYLPWLLGDHAARPEPQRFAWVLLLRTGGETLAVQVDSLRGNQEVVVKNAGPQVVRIVGITGVTVLGDGEIVFIINPVALASQQTGRTETTAVAEGLPAPEPVAHQTTVMIVDDSLTVRKITGRLLEREGYRVLTAKDGTDALEQLVETVPDVILSDIEMPRMDGFDLLRNLRADDHTREVPVIMITSRLADKHREYAMSLGASHYLGKPYDEDELLGIIASLTGTAH